MKTLLRKTLSSRTALAVLLPMLPVGLAGQMTRTHAFQNGAPRAALMSPVALSSPGIAAVSLSPNPVRAGEAVLGVVKLDASATEATTVTLASNIPTVARPALSSIVIKPGANSGTFTVNTRNVALRPVHLAISASANGTSKSAALTVLPK